MKLAWFKEVLNDPKAKQDLELTIKNSSLVLGRLKEILEAELRDLDNRQTSSDYKDASWAFKQADANGDKRRLKWAIDLINIERSDPSNE